MSDMRFRFLILLLCCTLFACMQKPVVQTPDEKILPLVGTWKLFRGTLIEKGDTVITDYTTQVSFIKIINDSHFAFLHHDINKGQDSLAVFSAGGGSYTLTDSLYTEHLEYCSAREWEGHDFTFVVQIHNDTLIQSGVEKIESEGIERMNKEEYTRVSK